MRTDVIEVRDNPAWMPPPLCGRDGDLEVTFRLSKAERNVYRKRKRIPVSRWAERHRVVTRGPFQGAVYRSDTMPYLGPVMDAAFFPSVETIILCAAPQTGKSFVIDTCIAYAIDRDPGPVLYVYPDEDTAVENNRDRILPMIRGSGRLRSYLTGSVDDEAAKRVKLQHMEIYMAWARSAAKLANKSIRYGVGDEIDKYPARASKTEAAPVDLLRARLTTYKYERKLFLASTPTVETGAIWQALTAESQVIFDYFARCPTCRAFQVMRWGGFRWPDGVTDPVRVETEDLAWYECEQCRAAWRDHERDLAVARGQWRARENGQALKAYLEERRPKKIAFHQPSWISRFVGISEVVGSYLSGLANKNRMKDHYNKHRAEHWSDLTEERREDQVLALRDDRPMGVVPGGGVVAALVAGVDTQDNGFYYRVRAFGWGMEQESWGVRFGFVDSLEALARVLWEEVYRDAEGNAYHVRLALQDAMGHRTAEVYDFVRSHPGRIVACQGVDNRRMTQPMSWSGIEFYPGTRKPIPGGIKLLRIDANYYKNIVAGKLEVHPGDPGAFHIEREANEEYARHMCAEVIDPDKQLWVKLANRANHYWDCESLCFAAADLLRVRFWPKEEEAKKEKAKPRRAASVARSRFMM